MTTITFDTLAYVKTPREAGVEENQAEAQATALLGILIRTPPIEEPRLDRRTR